MRAKVLLAFVCSLGLSVLLLGVAASNTRHSSAGPAPIRGQFLQAATRCQTTQQPSASSVMNSVKGYGLAFEPTWHTGLTQPLVKRETLDFLQKA